MRGVVIPREEHLDLEKGGGENTEESLSWEDSRLAAEEELSMQGTLTPPLGPIRQKMNERPNCLSQLLIDMCNAMCLEEAGEELRSASPPRMFPNKCCRCTNAAFTRIIYVLEDMSLKSRKSHIRAMLLFYFQLHLLFIQLQTHRENFHLSIFFADNVIYRLGRIIIIKYLEPMEMTVKLA